MMAVRATLVAAFLACSALGSSVTVDVAGGTLKGSLKDGVPSIPRHFR